MFWVRDLKLKLDQSDESKVTRLTQKKSLPQSLFLQIKGHYEVPLKKLNKKIQQNCLALMIITIYILFI